MRLYNVLDHVRLRGTPKVVVLWVELKLTISATTFINRLFVEFLQRADASGHAFLSLAYSRSHPAGR